MSPRNSNTRKSVNVRKQVRSAILASKEKKQWSASWSVSNTVAGNTFDISNGIAQGDDINQRTGDVIQPIKLHLNYTLTSGVGSTNSSHRILVVQDTMNSGVVPTIAQILQGGLYVSTYNLALVSQQKRFRILHDSLHGVVGQSNSAVVHVKRVIPLRASIYYNGAAAVSASNGRNAIFAFALTDSIAVSTAVFTAQYTLEFTDA